ncbi:MAG: aminotransferase class I/II-fold pyridoxal phosphate-dependent enzyme [Bacillota bacterium]|nr:aminotransferase class I/II-fold pyridoxal phosphate-dependent enzyme [Bacillota bacterium]
MAIMVAEHGKWPAKNDPIFMIAGKAAEAKEKHGADKVINSTIGALMHDDGSLVAFDSVYTTLKNLNNDEIAAYAPIQGTKEFLEAVELNCFGQYRPDAYIKSVATPGGTGGVKQAVWNYTNPGDNILTTNWYWSPYNTITEEIDRGVETFDIFDEDGKYNLKDLKEKSKRLLEKQKRLLLILNTPAHNPTGYSVSDEEWDEIIDFMKKEAEDKENKITILVDAAYIEFAGEKDERKKFFKKFTNLPDNLFIMVAFSTSKSHTMYGLRSGAVIGISSNEEIVEEFYYTCLHTARANWSNGTRGAMTTVAKITNDKNLNEQYETEKNIYKKLLRKRAEAFVEESEKVGLEILPYRDGFFVSIPCDDPQEASKKLMEENIFVVPLQKGLRFAVCAVSEEKCKTAPEKIKKALNK